MAGFGINVFDFGAKGDGITDDTKAIQQAIDYCAKRGGGRIQFPYTPTGYRIASPGIEEYEGSPVRAQLIIPPGKHNIMLEGEMPCCLLYTYQVRPMESVKSHFTPTFIDDMSCINTFLFSDWEAPEEHDPQARPWSILAAPQGDSCKGQFSARQFSIANLEFRVKLTTEKMYPTQGAVNLQNVSRCNVADCQFCLSKNVGDTLKDLELQPNPCHVVGFMGPGDQNDNVVIRNCAAQGFKYGFVFGEHVVADYLYVHNNEEAIVFHDCSHLSVINHVVAQHNTCILSTTRGIMLGHEPGPCNVIIGSVNFEDGHRLKPVVSQMKYGIYDPEERLTGELCWHEPWGDKEFPIVGASRMKVRVFGQ